MYLCLGISVVFFSVIVVLVFRLRLTIPLLYALLLPILCPEWYETHEALGNGIFVGLLGLVALSWFFSLIRKVPRNGSNPAPSAPASSRLAHLDGAHQAPAC